MVELIKVAPSKEDKMGKLSESIKEWMEGCKRNSVKPTTYDRLETSYNMLIQDGVSNIDVEALTAKDIQGYLNRLVANGYALSTIKKQFHLITAYLTYANAEGLIDRLVFKNVQLPSQTVVKKKKREVVTYSKQEQIALMKVLRTNEKPGYGASILMLESGMRVGEVLALTWDDVLWERRAIVINKTLIRIANRRRMEVQDGAKSYTSNRTIPLSTEAEKLLTTAYEASETKHGYIFHNDDGSPLSYEALRYQIQCACDKANVPYKGQHVFRHTFATNCYYRGCDVKILSKLLGHSNVTITYNIYIHLFGDAVEEMRSVLS